MYWIDQRCPYFEHGPHTQQTSESSLQAGRAPLGMGFRRAEGPLGEEMLPPCIVGPSAQALAPHGSDLLTQA